MMNFMLQKIAILGQIKTGGFIAGIRLKTFRAYSFHNQNMSTLSNVLVIHTALDKGETESTTAFTIPSEVMARVMKTGYGKFVVTNSIPCLRVVLSDGTISSAKVTSDGVVTLTAAAKGKLIIDGTLDIECNY